MAYLHRAELTPTKLELLTGWAPSQPWFEGDVAAGLRTVASFRFDDPEGEVGIETLLVRAGDGPVLQIPLTYRGAPLEGAEPWLIGTMQHSVLGERWTYDATGDPAYLLALATAVLTAGRHADQFIETDGVLGLREPTAEVIGSGAPGAKLPALPELGRLSTTNESAATLVEAGDFRVVVARVPGSGARDGATLNGTWTDHPEPTTFAWVGV
jgi:hypothetical protein